MHVFMLQCHVGPPRSYTSVLPVSLQIHQQELAKMPLVCQPGAEWNYSLSVDVQGRLIEVLTGMSFGEALEARENSWAA